MSCRSAQRHEPAAAQVRFYVDADILGLGKILGSLRNDVTYPGDPGVVIHKRHRAPSPIASPQVVTSHGCSGVSAGHTPARRLQAMSKPRIAAGQRYP